MARQRVYASDAERQKAYRDRLAASPRLPAIAAVSTRRRQLSRPARLMALCSGIEQLRNEYQGWLDSLPDGGEGDQAVRLTEAIEALEAVVDMLSEIQPPRGFGRD